MFVDAQNAANEGRKEMLETQRRVSSENLEARKLACLAAKDHKESVMLETYRSLMMQDATRMSEDVRSEHVLASVSGRSYLAKLIKWLEVVDANGLDVPLCLKFQTIVIKIKINGWFAKDLTYVRFTLSYEDSCNVQVSCHGAMCHQFVDYRRPDQN